MSAKESNERWENYVNNYIFANFESLEYWVAKRYATETIDGDLYIYNYIKFPKAENGRILTEALIKFMIQTFEAEDNICENIFGPDYKEGSAEIVDDQTNLIIVWNKHSYEELLDEVDDDETGGRWNTMIRQLYNWDIWLGVPSNISPEEKERRKKIDAELNRMAIALNDLKLGTAHRTPKEMEAIYNNYRFKGIDN